MRRSWRPLVVATTAVLLLTMVAAGSGLAHIRNTITAINEQSPGGTRLVVVIQNVTRARRLQQKMDAIDKQIATVIARGGPQPDRS